MPNSWVDGDKAAEYLGRADTLPHRGEGEGVLVRDLAGALPGRLLDLGCGDGRLTALTLAAYPESTALCVDMSPPMLEAAAQRFRDEPRVSFATHDLDHALPFDGPFDAIITSLAVHHVTDARKVTLYAEIAALLAPGGRVRQPGDREEPDAGAARPMARRDGRPRRSRRPALRHDEPARLDQRGRARERRLHLEVAQPGPAAGRTTPPLTSWDLFHRFPREFALSSPREVTPKGDLRRGS